MRMEVMMTTMTMTLLREGSSIVIIVIFAVLQLAGHMRTRVMMVTITLSHGGNNIVVMLSDARG